MTDTLGKVLNAMAHEIGDVEPPQAIIFAASAKSRRRRIATVAAAVIGVVLLTSGIIFAHEEATPKPTPPVSAGFTGLVGPHPVSVLITSDTVSRRDGRPLRTRITMTEDYGRLVNVLNSDIGKIHKMMCNGGGMLRNYYLKFTYAKTPPIIIRINQNCEPGITNNYGMAAFNLREVVLLLNTLSGIHR